MVAMKDYAKFIREFVKNPKRIGAITPSSKILSRKMVDWIAWKSVNVVIEYGPGTGIFTKHIISNMRPSTKYIAIEINPDFVATLRTRFPRVKIYHDSVQNVHDICAREAISEVDVVISGLPWALISHTDQEAYIDATCRVLKPRGYFATFAYLTGLLLPDGQHFKRMLHQKFSHVETSGTAWLNLPPAFVYRCTR
jgi:phospholipid N-methyltransferase